MTGLHPIRIANAAALVAGVLWTGCAVLVAAVPGPAMWVTGQMVHADLAGVDWHLTPLGFVVGLVAWVAVAWVAAAATAGLYRALSPGSPTRVPAERSLPRSTG